MKLKITICLLLTIGAWTTLSAQQWHRPTGKGYKTSFAIVVDDSTYQAARVELEAYKKAIERKGLGAYIISHHWTDPQQIREILQALYREKPRLEGAVLVGDIPVPMVRDAQHLTTAFKMNQQIDWKRSSVPSDRFYDDFDLEFEFLKQDSVRKNYFYYSLKGSSPQYIQMDIYTARIKPEKRDGASFRESIRQYLQKAVRQSEEPEILDQFMSYTGHGYHSESLNAWAGEQLALREQLPQLFVYGGHAKFLNFRMETYMRFPYLNEIQRPDLDLAIYHGHGSDDVQLLNGYPHASNPQPSIDNVRRYLRSKVQAAADGKGDVEAAKKRYHEWLDVPYSWMEDALADSVRLADSTFNAQTDLHIEDLRKIRPNAKMVLLDACDNGAFHMDNYIAAHYAFGQGEGLLTLASSVGVIQDQWANRLIGLLGSGLRVGNWFKEVAYLETHLFGDPTYAFAGIEKGKADDLDQRLVYAESQRGYWHKLLAGGEADRRALALVKLFELDGQGASGLLKRQFYESPDAVVRLQALQLLNRLDNADYREVLKDALTDPYELTRRLTAQYIGDIGSDEFIPCLVQSALYDRHSERVNSRLRNVMAFMDIDKVLEEMKRSITKQGQLTDGTDLLLVYEKLLSRNKDKLAKEYGNLSDSTIALKERRFSIRTLRAYRYHEAVGAVIDFAADKEQDLTSRLEALEALSWFPRSYKKQQIVHLCNRLLAGEESDALKRQASKTLAILRYSY